MPLTENKPLDKLNKSEKVISGGYTMLLTVVIFTTKFLATGNVTEDFHLPLIASAITGCGIFLRRKFLWVSFYIGYFIREQILVRHIELEEFMLRMTEGNFNPHVNCRMKHEHLRKNDTNFEIEKHPLYSISWETCNRKFCRFGPHSVHPSWASKLNCRGIYGTWFRMTSDSTSRNYLEGDLYDWSVSALSIIPQALAPTLSSTEYSAFLELPIKRWFGILWERLPVQISIKQVNNHVRYLVSFKRHVNESALEKLLYDHNPQVLHLPIHTPSEVNCFQGVI